MVFCKKCGKVNADGTKFCGGCGAPLEEIVENTEVTENNTEPVVHETFEPVAPVTNQVVQNTVVQEENEEKLINSLKEAYDDELSSEAKCWSVFAKLGFIFGLIGFILSCTIVLGFIGLEVAATGLVFSILGKRTKKEEYKGKANKGLVFSIIGTALGFVGSIVFSAILAALEASAYSAICLF